jgi:hypothetical protein
VCGCCFAAVAVDWPRCSQALHAAARVAAPPTTVPLPGYIRRSSNSAAACARGEFRGPSDPDDACRKCAAGVTTAGLASTSEADCNGERGVCGAHTRECPCHACGGPLAFAPSPDRAPCWLRRPPVRTQWCCRASAPRRSAAAPSSRCSCARRATIALVGPPQRRLTPPAQWRGQPTPWCSAPAARGPRASATATRHSAVSGSMSRAGAATDLLRQRMPQRTTLLLTSVACALQPLHSDTARLQDHQWRHTAVR